MNDTETADTLESFWLVDLSSSLTSGQPFAGLAEGEFTDMRGTRLTIVPDSIPVTIANTNAAIAQMQARNMPGLPIDARRHDKGEAAGWITSAAFGRIVDSAGRVRDAVYLAAEWTRLGVELISDKILVNFSPTFDHSRKVIRGGSLTNWLASVDDAGIPLFPAIELGQGVSVLLHPKGANMTNTPVLDTKLSEVPAVDLSAFQMPDALRMSLQQQMTELIEANTRQVLADVRAEMAAQASRARVVEFSQQVTGGTLETPRGIPVQPDRLANFMHTLSASQLVEFQAIVTAIWQSGLTEFSTRGHGGSFARKNALPADYADSLRAAVRDGIKPADWFAQFGELGDMGQYDLSAYEVKNG